jgi:hypothetical protein
LVDDKTYQKVLAHLPARRTSNVYVNFAALWRLLFRNLPPDDATRAMLDPIEAAGLAGAPFDARNGVGRATLFVYILWRLSLTYQHGKQRCCPGQRVHQLVDLLVRGGDLPLQAGCLVQRVRRPKRLL